MIEHIEYIHLSDCANVNIETDIYDIKLRQETDDCTYMVEHVCHCSSIESSSRKAARRYPRMDLSS